MATCRKVWRSKSTTRRSPARVPAHGEGGHRSPCRCLRTCPLSAPQPSQPCKAYRGGPLAACRISATLGPMSSEIDALKARLAEVADLKHAADLVEWDERVYMPEGGTTTHGEMQATLRRLAHERFTADDVGRAIERAARRCGGADGDSDDAAAGVGRRSRLRQGDAGAGRRSSPSRRTVDLRRAARLGTGARRCRFRARSSRTSRRILDLQAAVRDVLPAGRSSLRRAARRIRAGYDDGRRAGGLCRPAAAPGGADPRGSARGRRSTTASSSTPTPSARCGTSPSRSSPRSASTGRAAGRTSRCTRSPPSIGADDVRITTRWVDAPAAVAAVRHDARNRSRALRAGRQRRRTTARRSRAAPRSACTSRRAGCGRTWSAARVPFWEHFFPALQATFPAQLGAVTLDQFYRAINRVQPSLIRVEADEATYNLHVMLRVELEIALIEGSAHGRRPARALWRARMQEYLGLTPPERRDRRAAGHPLVGRPVRLLRHLHARQPDRRAAVGTSLQRGHPAPRRADPARRLLARCSRGCAPSCTSTGASIDRRNW